MLRSAIAIFADSEEGDSIRIAATKRCLKIRAPAALRELLGHHPGLTGVIEKTSRIDNGADLAQRFE